MLDFPTIEEAPVTAPAPQPVAAEQTRAITASIGMVQGEVAKFDLIAAGLKAIEDAHPKNVIVAAIDTPAGMKVAEAAWRAYRNPRLEVERARKAAKAPVLALGKAIDTFAGTLEDRLREGESHYKAQIDREEERKEAVRQEQARIEREAQERHTARLQTIASYLTRCQEPGMTAERIQKGIDLLNASDVSDEDTARVDALIGAKARALESMRLLHAQAVAREAEAARQEQIRLENERVAADLAAERARIAEEAAAIRRQAEELAAREAATRAAEAKQAEDALVASIHANSRRIEGDGSGYVQKAISYFESGACDWQDDPRPRVQEAINEGRRYLAAQLAAAMDAERPALMQELTLATASPCHQTVVPDRIRPDDPEAAPAATLEEMGGERPDVQDAIGLDEVNPQPAPAKPADTLQTLAAEARASKFPSQPKMGLEWWARFYALADAEAA